MLEIAETLESKFSEIAENKPEVLARHCAEAGDIERAAALWGKAGRRSAERSALVEATEQLRRALDMIATLSSTPALRREEIKLQVELITPLLHVRGYAAPETRAAVERARALIEQSARARRIARRSPAVVLGSLWPLGREPCRLQWRRDARACRPVFGVGEAQSATGPLMIGHRQMGLSLLHTGDITEGRTYLDHAIALYDPREHRHLATQFGQDIGAASHSWRSIASWLLGYPDAALADAERALKIARETPSSGDIDLRAEFQHLVAGLIGDFQRQALSSTNTSL